MSPIFSTLLSHLITSLSVNIPDLEEPEERRMAERARRLLSDDADRSSGEYGVKIKLEPGADGGVKVKQEPGVYDVNQDYI